MNVLNPYLKFAVAVLGAAATAAQTAGGTSRWEQVITAAITAALVFVTPNTPKGTS